MNTVSVGIREAVLALAALSLCPPPAHATDPWEPDDNPAAYFAFIESGHPPQVRDLAATGGVADVDWINIWMRSYRSYEVRTWNAAAYGTVTVLERWNYNVGVKLQDRTNYVAENTIGGPGTGSLLRWQTDDLVPGFFGQLNMIKIQGPPTATAANSTYTLQFRESTLFCPRFNNTNSQVSVLLVQAAGDGSNACAFSAHFFNEADGGLVATQTATLDFSAYAGPAAAMKVFVLPGVAGLANQKGMAQIAHTCGYGNLKAKLVALEPATGFSFDTPCTVREQ